MADFYKNFNVIKYGGSTPNTDGENTLANRGMIIQFTHVPTGNVVAFKAFITAFNEHFNSDWASEGVYGRADPIMLFKSTTRKITIAFKVPAATSGEAYENLGKTQVLTQFLYPTYADTGLAQTITQSPLVRIQVMNLLQNVKGRTSGDISDAAMYTAYKFGDNGLLGAINNVTVNHNLETDGMVEKGSNEVLEAILPKLIDIALEFSPIHEHPLGWNKLNKFGQSVKGDEGELFPYGVDLNAASDGSLATPEAEEAQIDAEELSERTSGADAILDNMAADEQAAMGTSINTVFSGGTYDYTAPDTSERSSRGSNARRRARRDRRR